VQEALRRVLEAVFEPMFYDEMMGFRPGRNCHQALRKLNTMIERNDTNYILDADIKGFFDHLDHTWIIKFVESRIKDPNIIRLVRRMLKAGIMKDYIYEPTEEGSGQGSVCSPILANLYMHYVLIWWFKERIQPVLKGYSGLVVYADDFVLTFQYKNEAERFYELLKRRMGNFGLSLEEENSRLIEFGRFAETNCAKRRTRPETSTFLGFTHYCSKSRNGKFRVKRKTSRKKFSKKLKEVHKKIGEMRMMKTKDIVKKLNEILVGYFHYYGITDNTRSIKSFRYEVMKSLFYWLNRRSQKKSYNWVDFLRMLDTCHPLAEARIYVSIYAQ
jgi:group II intron reverse transcriptase/maturase